MAELAVLATAMSSFAASGAGTILGLIGTGVSTIGALQAGQAEKEKAEFEAAQMEQKAMESRAAAQRSAMSERRRTDLAVSSLQARSASSGGGADDPTVIALAEGLGSEGEYQALTEMYKGENRARGLEDSAMGKRAAGDAAVTASLFKATGNLFSGISGLGDKGRWRRDYG